MADLQIFELLEPLESGGEARAQLLFWNGSTYIAIPNSRPIMLYDFVGSHGLAGDRGYCFRSWDSNRWEVAGGLFAQEYRRIG